MFDVGKLGESNRKKREIPLKGKVENLLDCRWSVVGGRWSVVGGRWSVGEGGL
jgi:hypothetical protein